MEAFRTWWEQASSRDQLAVVFCGITLAVYLLYVGVLNPVVEMRDKQLQRNVAQIEALERVREMAAKWVHHTQSSKKTSSGSVEKIVERSLSQNGLRVSSMDGSGRNGVRLRFEQAKFDNLLAWLYDMEVSQGMRIRDINVAGGSDPGTVSANLRVLRD